MQNQRVWSLVEKWTPEALGTGTEIRPWRQIPCVLHREFSVNSEQQSTANRRAMPVSIDAPASVADYASLRVLRLEVQLISWKWALNLGFVLPSTARQKVATSIISSLLVISSHETCKWKGQVLPSFTSVKTPFPMAWVQFGSTLV